MGKLYESVENLNEIYMQPNLNKDMLLKPKTAVAGPNIHRLLKNDVASNANKVFYVCSNNSYYHRQVAEDPTAKCPSCSWLMSTLTTYVASPTTSGTGGTSGAGEGGYVKGVVTYMVMDDLEVKPMSTISSIALLNRFSVKDVGALEEKVVSLDMDEGVKLLKASLQTKSVLTNVFLGKKAAAS